MTIDPEETANSLDDISRVERRTREAIIYAGSSSILILWGVLCAVGYVLADVYRERQGLTWLAINAVGFAATFFIIFSRRRSPTPRRIWDRRVAWSLAALVGYAVVWAILLCPTGRQADAFWPTVAMCGYVVAGLWLGRFFIYTGIAVTALTLIGYFWAGDWFHLWMAAVEGAGFILGGLWLRRAGSPA